MQNSEKAIQSIRYFYEEAPEYYIIAARSLLEVMLNSMKISSPVGRVEYQYLYPLSFAEFLGATAEQQALNYYGQVTVPALATSKLMELFLRYALVGGIPEIVKHYAQNKDIVAFSRDLEKLPIVHVKSLRH
ncbi:MAG: AAA family ATPase [Deltaproteobacteria bacterium]|nr:AAA family ATPase [Deltaproteobacteria bacterium]